MLADWQIALLDNGLWIIPALSVLALAVFPWSHWNSILDKVCDEGR